MFPISYDKLEDGSIVFSYDIVEYDNWKKAGEESGAVGALLMGWKGQMMEYNAFGTLEHPCKIMHRFSIIHHPAFDGERLAPEEYLKDKAEVRVEEYWKNFFKDAKMVILNLNENDGN